MRRPAFVARLKVGEALDEGRSHTGAEVFDE
jgi:hypothetical protein